MPAHALMWPLMPSYIEPKWYLANCVNTAMKAEPFYTVMPRLIKAPGMCLIIKIRRASSGKRDGLGLNRKLLGHVPTWLTAKTLITQLVLNASNIGSGCNWPSNLKVMGSNSDRSYSSSVFRLSSATSLHNNVEGPKQGPSRKCISTNDLKV